MKIYLRFGFSHPNMTPLVLFLTSRKPVRCTEKLLNMIFKEKIHQIMQSHANCTQYKTELVLVKL
jgi:hypothetical protein